MKKKILSVLLILMLMLSFGLAAPAPVMATDPPSTAPQMETIYPLKVITDATYNTLAGTVDLVFDFADGGAGITRLELDIGPDPYGGVNREQVSFYAVEGEGVVSGGAEELGLLDMYGVVPSYSATDEKWTIRIDTTATQTQAVIDLLSPDTPPFPWAPEVGDPIFPDGLFH